MCADLLTAAASVSATEIDYPTTSEEPIGNRQHAQNFTYVKEFR